MVKEPGGQHRKVSSDMTTIASPRRRAAWKPSRRLTDCVFRVALPGRHHNLDSALIPLMTLREVRA